MILFQMAKLFNSKVNLRHKPNGMCLFCWGDLMSGITELAKLFKERENQGDYSPMIGTIIELPDVRIRVGDKIILDASHLTMCEVLQHNEEYSDIGREVVLLPYADGQNFIVIGMVN